MHSRIAELLAYIDREQAALEAAVGSVPRARHSSAPADGRWSVAQIIQHLVLVERRVTGLITMQLATAKDHGLGSERSSTPILSTIDVGRFADRSRKFVFGGDPPSASVDVDAGLRALAETRVAFKAAVMQGDGFDLSVPSAPHRAFGQLNLYEWIGFVGAHIARHADQIREIGQTAPTVDRT